MKVDLYTYNKPTVQYHQPTFMAKPIKVNWNSESGKQLEKVLVWMGAAAMAGVNAYKNGKDSGKYSEEEKAIMEQYVDFNEEDALNKQKEILESVYKMTKDEKIIDKHWQLFQDAYKNKALLRGGYSELDDYTLTYSLINFNVVCALNLLGKGVLESAFSLDLGCFDDFCDDICKLQSNLSKQNQELLKKKINPESSIEYINLEEEIKKDKRKINKLLSKEDFDKKKELLEQIELIKGDKTKAKEIKELKSQIQNLYKNCKNSAQIVKLMEEVNKKQAEKKELLKQRVNLSPQEIINKVWTIAAISSSPRYYSRNLMLPDYYFDKLREFAHDGNMSDNKEYDVDRTMLRQIVGDDIELYVGMNKRKLNKDIKELINLIQPSTPENNKAWKDSIDKKLYEYAGIKYKKEYADKIDLANCKYINELIISDDDFWGVMTSFIQEMAAHLYNNPNATVNDVLNDFAHNIETKKAFETRNIEYDKWVNYNKDSYIESLVTLNAENAKRKAVKNLCDDLTSSTFNEIPQKERKSLYKSLKEIGVTINKNNVKIDGRDVDFEDLDLIMSVIKEELSTNTFWSTENDDETVETARDTMYCHFMLQRKQEIDCAKKLKDNETVNVKVKKVDMSDIKHSLCLGNHSHCCTALGSHSNEWSAPLYILNRCISAIEVLADGKPVGNTMIYLADVNGVLSLILDDIELQTKFQNNEKIKDMIVEYAKKLCVEIGQPNIPIYAGPGMHKVDMSNYHLVQTNMEIVGKTVENGGVYLDFDGGQHDIGNIIEETDLYRIA